MCAEQASKRHTDKQVGNPQPPTEIHRRKETTHTRAHDIDSVAVNRINAMTNERLNEG